MFFMGRLGGLPTYIYVVENRDTVGRITGGCCIQSSYFFTSQLGSRAVESTGVAGSVLFEKQHSSMHRNGLVESSLLRRRPRLSCWCSCGGSGKPSCW